MIKVIGVLSVAVLLSVAFIGCNSDTTEGFGRDVQKLGQKIEN